MRFVLPTTYARTRLYRPRKEAVPREPLAYADLTVVQVVTADKLRLNGWYALSRADRDGPRPLILYLPGACGHRGYRVPEVEMFARLGCDLLLVDYRGYGDNPGQPCERHLSRDARAVWRFAVDELHVPPERIVICGESVGAAIGTRLAAELCHAGDIPGGLILRAAFTCMLDAVSQFFPRMIAAVFLTDRYPSLRRIRHVSCPLLSIHGTEDRLIPIEMGRRLFAAAPAAAFSGQRKRFLELRGVDHNDILEEAGDLVEATLAEFLQRAVPSRSVDDAPSREWTVMQPLP